MAQAPRSLHIISSLRLSSGGPTHSVTQLCEALNALGAPAEIATVAGPGEESPAHQETPIHTFPLGWPSRLRRSPDLKAFLDAEASHFDLIHVHGLWQWPCIAGRRAALNNGMPLVISPRGMLEPWALRQRAWLKGLALSTWEGSNLKACQLLHATSTNEADQFKNLGILREAIVIPNGVDIPPEPELISTAERSSILFLSRFHPVKGGDLLIRAWAHLYADFPGWRLDLVGPDADGCRARWEDLARSLGIPSISIKFGKPVGGQEKSDLFASAGLLALPSHSENFGNVVIEALAHGVPVLTTQGTPWSGLQEHGCGWWVRCEETSLRDALRSALSLSEAERGSMGAKGRAWSKDFSWSAVAAAMISAYEGLLRMAAASPDSKIYPDSAPTIRNPHETT